MAIAESPEGCCQALLIEYQNLLMEKLALEEVLSQIDVPDWLDRYNRARAANQRTVGPAFHRLHEFARVGDWTALYNSLVSGINNPK